jgi:hypothetical protein
MYSEGVVQLGLGRREEETCTHVGVRTVLKKNIAHFEEVKFGATNMYICFMDFIYYYLRYKLIDFILSRYGPY